MVTGTLCNDGALGKGRCLSLPFVLGLSYEVACCWFVGKLRASNSFALQLLSGPKFDPGSLQVLQYYSPSLGSSASVFFQIQLTP
jgi:hypothetical protein